MEDDVATIVSVEWEPLQINIRAAVLNLFCPVFDTKKLDAEVKGD